MIFKFGTRKAFQLHKEEMPDEVFSHLRYSIDLLDENYGTNRDIDHDDGGFILLFTHAEDLAQVRSTTNIDFTSHTPEWADSINTSTEGFAALEQFFEGRSTEESTEIFSIICNACLC